MAQVICDVEAVGVLTARLLPEIVGGGENPFFDMQNFVTATYGNWLGEASYRGGRNAMLVKISASQAPPPEASDKLFVTPVFPSSRITISDIEAAKQLFASLNMYFDVIGYKAALKLTLAQLEQPVPSYMPNFERPESPDDPESPMVSNTWATWHDTAHSAPLIVGDFAYVYLCSNNNSAYVAGSICAQLEDDGLLVVGLDQVPTIEPENLV